MAKLKVIVPLLNKRSLPVGDTTDKSNVIGKVKEGFEFESVEQQKNALGDWFKDRDGSWYWGGGVSKGDAELSEIEKSNGHQIPWWMLQFKIPEIWSMYNEKGVNAKVAVIDSGYNTVNPEIKDGVVAEYVHPSFPDTVTINDILGHGSYCASIIGARNRLQIIGCAPDCKLFVAKVTSRGIYDNNKVKDAIKWAIDQQVDIISLSIGGDKNDDINALITIAQQKNIIVISSIGNNDNPESIIEGGDFPALYSDTIAVGATDEANKLSKVTLLNEKTEINAPGENISGYILDLIPGTLPAGTSQATAIVAGICALIVSRHRSLNRNYTSKTIRELICNNTNPVSDFPNQKLISPTKIFEKI